MLLLEKLSRHPNADAFLLLLVLDWSWDTRYQKPGLFESFQSPELYDKQRKVIRLAGTCIKVQLGRDPWGEVTEVRDPSVFFRQSNGRLWTNILYYSDDSIHTIGEECIRGIDGVDRRNKQHIRERCSMDILFRDGIVRGMMLFAHERPTEVFGIRSPQRQGDNNKVEIAERR